MINESRASAKAPKAEAIAGPKVDLETPPAGAPEAAPLATLDGLIGDQLAEWIEATTKRLSDAGRKETVRVLQHAAYILDRKRKDINKEKRAAAEKRANAAFYASIAPTPTEGPADAP
jgi:hypothetical protein